VGRLRRPRTKENLNPRHAELGSASIVQQTQSMNGEMDPGAEGVQRTNKFRVTVEGGSYFFISDGVITSNTFRMTVF
jgi:hypothetical protein